jgi:uncharacterized protein
MAAVSDIEALDKLLLSLPMENDGMLLAEFDGFCTGLIVSPEMIPPSEWLPQVWGPGGVPEFESEADLQNALDLIMGHYNEVAQLLSPPDIELSPVFGEDLRNGDILWETWVLGFERAMRLRMNSWERIVKSSDEEAASSVTMMLALYQIAEGKSDLPAGSIEELTEQAPALIPDTVFALNAWTKGNIEPEPFPLWAAANSPSAPVRTSKAGRNDPCPCGSGRKYKRCCGAN